MRELQAQADQVYGRNTMPELCRQGHARGVRGASQGEAKPVSESSLAQKIGLTRRPATTRPRRPSSVSSQATPNRPPPARIAAPAREVRPQPSQPPPLPGYLSSMSPLLALSNASLMPAAQADRSDPARMTPIKQIEAHLATWCSIHGGLQVGRKLILQIYPSQP